MHTAATRAARGRRLPLELQHLGTTALLVAQLPPLSATLMKELWRHADAVLDVGLSAHPQSHLLVVERQAHRLSHESGIRAAQAPPAVGNTAATACQSGAALCSSAASVDGRSDTRDGLGASAGSSRAGGASPQQSLGRYMWLPVKGPKQVGTLSFVDTAVDTAQASVILVMRATIK